MKQADLRHLSILRTPSDDHFHFDGLTPQEGRKLMTGYPNIDGENTHEISPKAKELVQIAEQYNGTLSGYVISVSSGQPNPRITLNGFTITCSNKEMREIRKKLKEADHEPTVVSASGTRKGENLKRYTFLWD